MCIRDRHTTAHLHHGTTLFGAIYLLSHGIAKIVLVALVLKDKLWAYPWLIGLLLAFIAYQLYRITAVHFSVGLALLTVFDAFLVWLTWREFRAKRAMRHRVRAPAAAWSSQDRPGKDGGQERAAEVAGSAPPQPLADALHGAVTSFVTDLTPGWARYEPDARLTRIFGENGTAETDFEADPLAAERAMWGGRWPS